MAEVLTPEAYALLEAIAGSESRGAWDVSYGGKKFSDFSAHPRQFTTIKSGPNAGKKSSAAGKFQITSTTYDRVAPKLGIKDFSPESQQRIAWHLAKEQYGPSLETDLAKGDSATLARVAKKLAPVWTSLPSGIEQGTTTNRFVARFQQAKSHPVPPGNIPGVASLTDTARTPEPAVMSASMAQRRSGPTTLSFKSTPSQLEAAKETLRAGLAKKPTTTRESIFNPERSTFSDDPMRSTARFRIGKELTEPSGPPVMTARRPTVTARPTVQGTAGLGARSGGTAVMRAPTELATRTVRTTPINLNTGMPFQIGAAGGAQGAAGVRGGGATAAVLRPAQQVQTGMFGRGQPTPKPIPGPEGYTVANKDPSRLSPTGPLAIAGAPPTNPAVGAIQAATGPSVRQNWMLSMLDPTVMKKPVPQPPLADDTGLYGFEMSPMIPAQQLPGAQIAQLPKPPPLGTPNILGGMQLTKHKPVIESDLTPHIRAMQNQAVLDAIKRRGAISSYTTEGGRMMPVRAMNGKIRNSYGDESGGNGSLSG